MKYLHLYVYIFILLFILACSNSENIRRRGVPEIILTSLIAGTPGTYYINEKGDTVLLDENPNDEDSGSVLIEDSIIPELPKYQLYEKWWHGEESFMLNLDSLSIEKWVQDKYPFPPFTDSLILQIYRKLKKKILLGFEIKFNEENYLLAKIRWPGVISLINYDSKVTNEFVKYLSDSLGFYITDQGNDLFRLDSAFIAHLDSDSYTLSIHATDTIFSYNNMPTQVLGEDSMFVTIPLDEPEDNSFFKDIILTKVK